MSAPANRDAEASVVNALLANPKLTGVVMDAGLQQHHFTLKSHSSVYAALTDAYLGGDPSDLIAIADQSGVEVAKLQQAALKGQPKFATDHARLVKRDADRRELLSLAAEISATAPTGDPEAVAAMVSEKAMNVAMNTALTKEVISYGDLGRRFVQRQKQLQAAQAAGIELGVRFGLKFLDHRLHGLQPTELMILSGEPGVGKSAVAFCAATEFARRQMIKPPDARIATLILSLEMGEGPTSDRLAQTVGRIDSSTLRDGTITDDQLGRIVNVWGMDKNLPLYFNFASLLRASQARALIADTIRRYNVGFVVVDHMRYFDADERYDNAADEDEAKARFLKERVAKDLNCAVLLLAHTTKAIENRDDRRPKLGDLRGGGMVAAHADVVAFVYNVFKHASDDDVLDGRVKATDMETIFEKNRHGLTDPTRFTLDPSVMEIADRP